MNRRIHRLQAHLFATLVVLGLYTQPSMAQITDIANAPLAGANSQVIKPNVFFVLDDSGSMGFDFMPDHTAGGLCRDTGVTPTTTGTFTRACCQGGNTQSTCLAGNAPFGSKRMHPPLLASSFNTMAYNPGLRYLPGVNADNTSMPSMTAANTSNWQSVLNDYYAGATSATINLVSGFPDVLWCPATNSLNSACLRNGNYILPGRINNTNYTTFRAGVASGTGLVIDGAPDATSTVPPATATLRNAVLGPHYYRIVASEFCSSNDLRDCVASATASHSIAAPVRWCRSDAISRSASPAKAECQAVRTDVFQHARYPTKYSVTVAGVRQFPGSFQRVDIVPGATFPRGAERTDCAASTLCTYEEEMTNFANWWAYHRTRMQTMKSGVSRSFAVVTDTRRIGFGTINTTNGAFVNISDFNATHKQAWFSKMLSTVPSGSTPLRGALARAGRLYGGKLPSFNNVAVVDPIQASCQRNFTILSTDGFWNENNNAWVQMDGSTLVGEQDSGLPLPKKDSGPTANTLADVAAYYFNTDLRTGAGSSGPCISNGKNVCGTVGDTDEVQNMRTMTLGLGASGYMQFNPNYLTATSGDYHSIKNGVMANPANGICNWQSSGACTWPAPLNNTLTAIDDLWHAAVNGVGDNEPSFYFSATDPASLYSGLKAALEATTKLLGAGAAAATSSANISAGKNQVFLSRFTTKEWSGQLESRRINVSTGQIDASAAGLDWTAGALLDAKASRQVVAFDQSTPNKLRALDWANLSASEQAFFKAPAITAAGTGLSQFCSFGTTCLSSADQMTAEGKLLLDFVLGDRTHEGPDTDITKYFRERTGRLGDIVSSAAVFVGLPSLAYPGAAYATYKTVTANRLSVVYAGSNGGMLHAFNAATGDELWAYVPTAVMPNLYRLADKDYATKHTYFVDSTPAVADVLINGEYRTILVGGLGAGGRSYFALDVTDPTQPKALWEITSNTSGFGNLGLTMGKPEIGLLKNGTWAVFFASGYNNVNPGNGRGYLFVVDAATGALINAIDTGAGAPTTPSGLAHIRAWVDDSDVDGTVPRVYGGDNLGNVWRFDVNGDIGAPGTDAQRLVSLKDDSGNAQPITSRPELGKVGNQAMVYVGTGRYLGVSDLSTNKTQSIYGVKDRLSDEDYGNVRAATQPFIKQVLQQTSPTSRTMSAVNAVNLASDGGCYVDLPTASERVNTDPQIALGTLIVVSNVIDATNQCKVGGNSWVNYLDYRTCGSVQGQPVSASLGNALGTGVTPFQTPSGELGAIVPKTDGTVTTVRPPGAKAGGTTRRLSWRDLVRD